jgi:hypothetical protein
LAHARCRWATPRARSFSSPSEQSEQFAGHDQRVGQRPTAICVGLPIASDRGPRENGNATEFKTYGAIGVTPALSTVRARTLAVEVRSAAGAVISAKCLALWSNRAKTQTSSRVCSEPLSRPATHGAPPSAAYIRDVSRVGAQRRFAVARTPLAARAGPGSLLMAQVPSPADPSRTRRPRLRRFARAFAGRWRVPGSKESCRIFR